MSERKQRKAVLQEIGLNALRLAAFISDERYLRSFNTTMRVVTESGHTQSIQGTRLGRLSRPLWLGSDGVIYYRYSPWRWERAALKRRDLDGLRRVNTALERALQHLLETSPGSMQYRGEK